MKAIRIHQYGDGSTLKLEEIPRLPITDDQLLVRIRDAGVNPIDWKIRQGYMKQDCEFRLNQWRPTSCGTPSVGLGGNSPLMRPRTMPYIHRMAVAELWSIGTVQSDSLATR
jgi:hypothetical protein